MRYFSILLVVFAISPFCALGAERDQQEDLDSLISGFEDESSDTAEESSDELELLLGGFEEPEQSRPVTQQNTDSVLPDWLDVSGSIGLQSTLNFSHQAPPPNQPDYRGLSLFRTIGDLIADTDYEGWKGRLGVTAFYDAAYHLNGQRDLYTETYIDLYESEFEINEAYLMKNLTPHLDLKVGRQIVVWGKSDSIRVTDVLNPLDLRWPGMVDIRFLRLPVTMTKLDYFHGYWNLGGMLIHEPRFNKVPVYNSEFYPGNQTLPKAEEPGVSWDNQQAALAVNGIFSGWDISVYGGYLYNQAPRVDLRLRRVYDKSLMAGMATNIALGNWLIKGEAAYWDGLKFSNLPTEDKSRLDLLIGFDYSGFTDTLISLELANRHLFEFDPRLEQMPDNQKEDWNQFSIRYVRDFVNDTLHLTLLVSSYGLIVSDGGFERFQVEYDLSDAITLTGGVVLYQSGDYPAFSDIGDNDRLLFEIEYRF